MNCVKPVQGADRLQRDRTLLRRYSVRARIVFHHNLSSEYHTSFIFLELLLQLRVLEVAHVHQRSKMNCPSLFCASWMTSSLFLTFVICQAGIFRAFPTLCQQRLSQPGFFIAWGTGINECNDSTNENLPNNAIFMIFQLILSNALSRRFEGLHDACLFWSASTGFVFARTLQGTADSIDNSNFLRFFHGVLGTSCHPDRWNKCPRFSSIVELRLVNSPMLFLYMLRSCRHTWPNLWPWTIGRWFCFEFFVSGPPDHVYPSGGFSSNIVNCVKQVHLPDSSRSPFIVAIIVDAAFQQHRRKVSPCTGNHFFVVNRFSTLFQEVRLRICSYLCWSQSRIEIQHSWWKSTLISIPCWYKWYVTLTSNTGPIFVFPRIHPFGVDLAPLRGDVYARHDPACPNPVESMSWIVMKYWPGDIFLIKKPASSPALLTRTSSGRFSNLLMWRCNRSLGTGTVIEGGFVKIDTTVGEIRDSDSSFISATGLSVLENEFSKICWTSFSHQSEIAPWTLSWLTEMIMRNKNSAVVGSPLSYFLLFKDPPSNAHVDRNIGFRVSFLAARWNITLIQLLISRAVRSTRILRRSILCALEVPWHQIHRSRFRHCRTFFRYIHDLSWAWHSAFCLKENGCKNPSRNSCC